MMAGLIMTSGVSPRSATTIRSASDLVKVYTSFHPSSRARSVPRSTSLSRIQARLSWSTLSATSSSSPTIPSSRRASVSKRLSSDRLEAKNLLARVEGRPVRRGRAWRRLWCVLLAGSRHVGRGDVNEQRQLLPGAGELQEPQGPAHVRVERSVEDDRSGGVDHDVHLARELREVLLAKPQRRRVYIPLQNADLLRDLVLEVVAQLLTQTAQSRGAEDILLEPLCGALATGGPDDEVEAPEVGEGAQDLLDQRRPQEAGPPRKQYLLVLVRLAEQLASLLCPLAYLPLGALQEGSRVLPVPPQDERAPDHGVEHVRERLA